ncbi:GH3 auxin-responsive promoter family protein [bacterium]|nr:GH3 auxin-responsive promoter family protein [bacterium]
MKTIKSKLSLVFAKYVVKQNNSWKKNPLIFQKKIMLKLIDRAKNTSFGKDHSFGSIKNYEDFKKNIPIRDYEDLSKYIDLIKQGKKNILWPGYPKYLCKTSGTTSGTKYIPLTTESIKNHLRPARDAILSYLNETKNSSIVSGKMIFLQGSPKLKNENNLSIGRLSGIVAHHIPFYLKNNRLPTYESNCIEDWEKKVDAIVEETKDQNMSLISGIPPWVQMYFEKLTELSGKSIKELFPNFKLFIYGGVNYEPYKKTLKRLIGGSVDGVEVYPASEGFIAYQDSQKEKGMILCVNNGIFFEFIKTEDFFNQDAKRIWLEDVEVGVDYVIILNTNAGLWGYNIGDTIKFVSKDPYRIIVSGRVKHFTSAFGEHVISEEVEKSMNNAAKKHKAEIGGFHVAPLVNPKKGLPRHQWFVEFLKEPEDLLAFSEDLDVFLQEQNTYYKDLISGSVLSKLDVIKIQKNGFNNYMKDIGKLGGQNKIPRLSNDRKIAKNLIKYKK